MLRRTSNILGRASLLLSMRGLTVHVRHSSRTKTQLIDVVLTSVYFRGTSAFNVTEHSSAQKNKQMHAYKGTRQQTRESDVRMNMHMGRHSATLLKVPHSGRARIMDIMSATINTNHRW